MAATEKRRQNDSFKRLATYAAGSLSIIAVLAFIANSTKNYIMSEAGEDFAIQHIIGTHAKDNAARALRSSRNELLIYDEAIGSGAELTREELRRIDVLVQEQRDLEQDIVEATEYIAKIGLYKGW